MQPSSTFRRAVSALILGLVWQGCAAQTHAAAPASSAVAPAATLLHRLGQLRHDEHLTVTDFPLGGTHRGTLDFERVEVYAPQAHIYLEAADGRHELPRSQRIFLHGFSTDGSARVALSLNPDFTLAEGNGLGPNGAFVLGVGGGIAAPALTALDASLPPGTKLAFKCGNESANFDLNPRGALPSTPTGGAADAIAQQLKQATTGTAAVTASSHALREATVGVDTDTLFMSKLFSNNTATATNWIASMFNGMNLMYQHDLTVHLLQGTTFLRTTTPDPYASASDVPADGTDLGIFGSYWQTNNAGVSRTFATLLSGRGPCVSTPQGIGCQASGIAWINSYCRKPSSGGSYSVVQVFSSLSIDPNAAIAARLVGHELGHNFGADHTHCTDVTTGAAKVATNTIDKCYNLEASSGCYGGTSTTCPSSGPGAPAGTIMSYCNTLGCGSDGQNALVFHPTQVTVLDNVISSTISNQPGCLNTTDDIFYSGFE